jgi:succinyl-CoA synthetase beta subunit
MKLHEYQSKEFFSRYGIPIPTGKIASTAIEAQEAASSLEGSAVIKAQIHAGGRGKGGGIRVVNNPEEAHEVAESLIGSRLVTPQTGPSGIPVNKVLIEQTIAIDKELYLAIAVDGSIKAPVIIASASGGIDIEQVANETPDKITQVRIDPTIGYQPFMGRKVAYFLGLPTELVRPFSTLVGNLYNLFREQDASLVEINPLTITDGGELLALDAKIDLEDDALNRHPQNRELRDKGQEDPLEMEADEYGLNYIRLDGNVGCMVNGAGLAMATMDIVRAAGSEPANFLDIGGGADETKIAQAFKLICADPKVDQVLINIFGGILRCDVAARGIIQGYSELASGMPIIVRMRGTNVEEGRKILSESNVPLTFVNELREAIPLLQNK